MRSKQNLLFILGFGGSDCPRQTWEGELVTGKRLLELLPTPEGDFKACSVATPIRQDGSCLLKKRLATEHTYYLTISDPGTNLILLFSGYYLLIIKNLSNNSPRNDRREPSGRAICL